MCKPLTRAAGIFLLLTVLFAPAPVARADDAAAAAAAAAADAKRQQAIADYTQKMQDANYPALFDQAAQEFNVPPDVLKAVSFAETRWTQLQWPPGETASPDTGMPHAYGIMSLWDNDVFGHTLLQAAQLIGEDPQVLKTDALQNMRGGAALLRQIYDQTPRPEDAPDESQIESWRKAIAKYTGIPQPELSEAHALRVYEYMNQGYHQYGIEWNAHPVNLGPMRADVARIKAAALGQTAPQPIAPPASTPPPAPPKAVPQPAPPVPAVEKPVAAPAPIAEVGPPHEEALEQRWLLLGLMAVLLGVAIWHKTRRNK